MAAYWEAHHCKDCYEPLDTEGEKDMGCHYECETPDNHNGAWANWEPALPGYAGLRGCNAQS